MPASQTKGALVNLSMCENSCRFSLSKTLILQNTQFLCSSQPQPSGKWLLCLKSKEKRYHYLSWNTLDSSDKEGNDQGPFQRGWLQIGLLGQRLGSKLNHSIRITKLLYLEREQMGDIVTTMDEITASNIQCPDTLCMYKINWGDERNTIMTLGHDCIWLCNF